MKRGSTGSGVLRHPAILFAWCVGTIAPAVPAQEAVIFERLAGEWRGDGTLMGRAAKFTMHWKHQDGFAVLTFANAFVGADGKATRVLNATAVYRTSPSIPEAVWLDSRGVRIEIRWESSDSTLVSHWTAPTEEGRTTYRVRAADSLEVIDEVVSGEVWRTFATARYARVREVRRSTESAKRKWLALAPPRGDSHLPATDSPCGLPWDHPGGGYALMSHLVHRVGPVLRRHRSLERPWATV